MVYTLQSDDELGTEITIRHESNEPFITIFITKNPDTGDAEFLDIDLDKKDLHDFIGTLLHVQSKIRK